MALIRRDDSQLLFELPDFAGKRQYFDFAF